jgi:uncharacterized protein
MLNFYAPSEFKVNPDSLGQIQGYGSTFNNVDADGDTVRPGAFKDSIYKIKSGENPWPAMLHGTTDETPVGVWTGIDEDAHGLKLAGKLALDTSRGRDAYQLLKMSPRPALSGLSIGYTVRDAERHPNGSGPNGAKRTLKSVDLRHVSLVNFPSDKFARISSVKSWGETPVVDDAELLREWRRREEAILREANRHGR